MPNDSNGTTVGKSGSHERFKRRVRKQIKNMAPADLDPYREIQFSDTLYLHVGSHPNGAGSIELTAIVPHDHNGGYDTDANQLFEVPEIEEFYNAVIDALNSVTEGNHDKTPFYLMEQVTDGTWERDANTYETHEIEVELTE